LGDVVALAAQHMNSLGVGDHAILTDKRFGEISAKKLGK
jgi:hypothetical protein